MKALYYEQFRGPIQLTQLPDPSPNANSVVLQIKASGLCRSDWHGWMGHDADITLPHVPGHELAGEVVAVGKSVKHWHRGDRVTVPFVGGCGSCAYCAAGQHQVCPDQFQPGFTHWGSFAEYVAIDFADINLVRLPDTISYATAASLGCRFATSFRAIVDQAQVQAGQWVVVFGCGGVGLSAIMIAQALGAAAIGVDIQPGALEAAQQMGASATIQAGTDAHVVEQIREITKGGAHVSVDALGHSEVLFQAIQSLRRQGKHIQIGLLDPAEGHPPVPMGKILAHELEIIGSHGMQAYRYDAMFQMIEQGILQPQRLIQQKLTLEDAATELVRMNEFRDAGIKVITEF